MARDPVDPDVAEEVSELAASLLADGSLRPLDELALYHGRFRERFGPSALEALSGEALEHALGLVPQRDPHAGATLLHWLLRKDDAELPALFGDARERAGAGALPTWGSPPPGGGEQGAASAGAGRGPGPDEIRAELVEGARVIERLAGSGGSDADGRALERELALAAPRVAGTAAGHKYFSLLFPGLLTGFHTREAQRFHLVRALVAPPDDAPGRYAADLCFLEVARELGLPLSHLWAALEARDGPPRRYFRLVVGPRSGRRLRWLMMREGGFIAIGRSEPGDLAELGRGPEAREAIRAGLARHYGDNHQRAGRAASQFHRFVAGIDPGDLVLASDGARVLGVGRITGPYAHVDDRILAHRRPVEWLPVGELSVAIAGPPKATLHELLGEAPLLIEVERALLRARRAPGGSPPMRAGWSARAAAWGGATAGQPEASPSGISPDCARQRGPLGALTWRIAQMLERKGQVILHGPPGTGKTHHAEQAARELAARSWFGAPWRDLSDEARSMLVGNTPQAPGAIEVCSFHPSFGYEDFLEGYRPHAQHGALGFERRDGLFKRLCHRATQRPERWFFLVIDEINRGDIPRIFGELLTVIERGRRGQEVTLPLSGERFSVPPNVGVLGTMNTADRSIALLDAALRRRFGFVELMPDPSALGRSRPGGVPLGALLEAINDRVVRRAGRGGRELQVGHAYFMHEGRPIASLEQLALALRDDVAPLLQEHCYGDWGALEGILGAALIDRDRQRVDESLFEPERGADLVRALLEAFPELHAAADAADAADAGEERGEAP
jgi:5-methylcytosine-specific restriction enzyme B